MNRVTTFDDPRNHNGLQSGAVPFVTILMASYGRLPLLKKSIDSALAQDYPNFEVLVVDDGSDEENINWLRASEAKHNRLRVIFQRHQGVATARARGVTEAYGELVCILDSDDMLVSHALTRLTEKLERHPDSELVYSSIREHRPNGMIDVRTYPTFRTARGMLRATLLKPRVPFKHSGTTFRRSTAIDLGSYDRDLPCKVDIDLYLKFLSAGHQPQLVSEALVDFRMHKDSISYNRMQGLRVWFRLIDRYGPANPAIRLCFKATRAASELLKQVYMKVSG